MVNKNKKLMKLKSILVTIASLAVLSGCKDKVEKPDPNNEQELITSVILTFTDTANSTTSTFAFRDVDGVGGSDAVGRFNVYWKRGGPTIVLFSFWMSLTQQMLKI